MLYKKSNKGRKRGKKMATLATPKGSSYVIRKECVKNIVNSKNTPSVKTKNSFRAQQFVTNNLNKK